MKAHHTLIVLPLLSFPVASSHIACQTIQRVQLIDSVRTRHWSGMDDTYSYRFLVTTAQRTDTIADLVDRSPVVSGDTVVVGVVFNPSALGRRLLVVRPNRPPQFVELPSDLWPFFTDLAVSPDARHLLYLATDRLSDDRFMVRALADGSVIWAGLEQPPCDCDVDRNHARWLDSDTFEVATRIDLQHWRIARVALSGSTTIDTIGAEPRWH